MFKRKAEAYVKSQKLDDQARAVLQLWSNLRGAAADAVKDMTVDELLAVAGAKDAHVGGFVRMFEILSNRWPEGPLGRLPRLYKGLFSDVRYKQGDDVASVLAHLEQAKRELEAADEDAKVSTGIMGYLAL